ncbi:MAG: sulfatase-like hydrolase/transferase [Planctomycetota bacterium]
MMRTLFLAVFIAILPGTGAQAQSQDVTQPNIVILLADDLGYGELLSGPATNLFAGQLGDATLASRPNRIPTPNIDSIADSGVQFTQAYVTGPNCSPSRAGLLTGKIPTRFGYEFNPIGARNEQPGIGLPPSQQTLAELLHDRGYTTGLIGKWHLGGSAAYHPHRHGFDEFFGFTHEGHYFVPPPYDGVMTMLRRKVLPGGRQGRWIGNRLIYSSHMGHDEPDYDANNPMIRGGQPESEQSYLTDAFTRESVSFIKRHADQPFFLYVAYNAVHSPLQAKLEDYARFDGIADPHRRVFAAMLASLDQSVGKILRTLESESLQKQTLVVFLSDNGGPTKELTSSNWPLRGQKGQMYEGGIRIPMSMTWPGTLPKAMLYKQPVSSADLYATAANIAGVEERPRGIDGVDLMPYLNKAVDGRPHQRFFWRQGLRSAIRIDDWKLVRDRGGKRGLAGSWELYDLSEDITEGRNVAETEPVKLREMIKAWTRWDGEMAEPLF